jgi:hypothetical protein
MGVTDVANEQPRKPQAWLCDICWEPIPSVGVGLVIWQESKERPMHDFKIVHKTIDPWRCWDRAEAAGYRSSEEIDACTGVDGLTNLLSWLSLGPLDAATQGRNRTHVASEDLDDFVDLVRRLQIPYYEEARRRFGDQEVHEELAGVNPVYPYTVARLRWAAAQPH